AKVIGLADVYESLTHARPYRGMLVGYELQQITREHGGAFPDRILRATVQAFSHPPTSGQLGPSAGRGDATETLHGPEAPTPLTARANVELLYRKARQELAQIVAALSEEEACELGAMQRLVADMIESLEHEDELLIQVLQRRATSLDLPLHMIDVAVLAVKIGQGVGYGEKDLQRLALAACLHDVGLVGIPTHILEKSSALAPDELAILHTHPEKGSRMLRAFGAEFDWLATVASHEHEREDGSGYPLGLKGDQIHEYAKIIGLADVYESMTHARSRQRTRVPFDAVREIMTANRHMFLDRILKGLIQGLSTFPVGTLVRLNSKETARVVATNPAFPLRPVVEILTDPQGERLAPVRRVDLAQNSLLYITDAAPNDVEGDSGAA
ncbi:MAG TPA: HD-GYP domain-containing protein, partial [archaeon]|nr:HD-GYP domain-containing protein [archaeon]